MACPVLISPACVVAGKVAGAVAGTAASGALNGIAAAIESGITWMVTQTATWWVQVPSPDLAGEPAVGQLQQWMLPLAVAVAVLGLIIAGGKMALTRRANPLIDVGSGLAVIAATSAVGVLLPSLLLKAGDAWSSWVLQASTGGQFTTRLVNVLTLGGSTPSVVVVLGIVAIIICAIQAVLMLFRQGALVVLAGVLPLAAAGMLTPATRGWFRRVTGWMLALIFYKPAAAAVYATAFTMIGTGKDPRTVLMGFAMVFLSLLALPVLMRFFTWTTGHVADASGGGGFLQTALQGAVAVGALRGMSGGAGGSGPVEQARLVTARLGPSDSGPAGAPSSGAGGRPGAPPAPGSGAPATTPGTAAGSAAAAPAARAGAASGAAAAGTGAGSAAAAGAAAGPAGIAAAGLAAGAASARRKATEAMQPPGTPGGDQHELPRHERAPGLRRVAPPPRHRDVRVRRRGDRRRARRAARPDHRGHRGCCRAAVRRAPGPAGRRAGPGPGRRGAAGAGRAAAAALALRLGAELHGVPGRGGGRAFPRVPDARGAGAADAAGRRGRVRRALRHRAGPAHRADDPHLRVIPASTWLADRQDADTWVANWGGWLASLGYLPMVRWVTVTIDTAPEPGTSLADSVAAALDPASPLAARQIMGQLVESAPAAAADVDTRVSISFDPKLSPAAPADPAAAAAEVGRTMHGLESALGTCGVTVLGRASAAELAGIVRTAFDPAARGEVNRILAPPQPAPPAAGAELGRCRAGRGRGRSRLLPARQRDQRDLGMAGGTPADRDRRRARPPGRPGPLSQAGLAAVPAVPGRRSHPRAGKRGERRPVPGRVQAPHRAG